MTKVEDKAAELLKGATKIAKRLDKAKTEQTEALEAARVHSIAMRKAGIPITEIAKEIGISRTTLYQWIEG